MFANFLQLFHLFSSWSLSWGTFLFLSPNSDPGCLSILTLPRRSLLLFQPVAFKRQLLVGRQDGVCSPPRGISWYQEQINSNQMRYLSKAVEEQGLRIHVAPGSVLAAPHSHQLCNLVSYLSSLLPLPGNSLASRGHRRRVQSWLRILLLSSGSLQCIQITQLSFTWLLVKTSR